MHQYKLVILGLAAFALAGCGGNDPVPDPEPTETAGGAGDDFCERVSV